MKHLRERSRMRLRWHNVVIGITIAGVGLAAAGVVAMLATRAVGLIPQTLFVLAGGSFIAALIIAVLGIVTFAYESVNNARDTGEKLDRILSVLEKNQSLLVQIGQTVCMGETARSIVYRDANRQALTEAVREKLHQHDFEGTYAMIDEISTRIGYTEIANQLRLEADKYRDATEDERISQTIAHIEKLFDRHQWTKAAAQIERLVKVFDGSEQAKQMPQRLVEKKEQRKRELLAAWDEAVKRRETDRSLEILRELDLYLTPNEGLALQESARDVFRTKLHNLGVQFSLAVSDKQWAEALTAGEQIIRDFPNSRMAQEIRGKISILKERAKEQKVSP